MCNSYVKAKPDCIVMHVSSAPRQEITNEVVDSKNSVVFDEAENRLCTKSHNDLPDEIKISTEKEV